MFASTTDHNDQLKKWIAELQREYSSNVDQIDELQGENFQIKEKIKHLKDQLYEVDLP
jgi:predicted nuclease with TOPRIM domain